jgi:ornithine cyclodeaminase/alanine dehydrogenase-like protein (mu-crystallin family)
MAINNTGTLTDMKEPTLCCENDKQITLFKKIGLAVLDMYIGYDSLDIYMIFIKIS